MGGGGVSVMLWGPVAWETLCRQKEEWIPIKINTVKTVSQNTGAGFCNRTIIEGMAQNLPWTTSRIEAFTIAHTVP